MALGRKPKMTGIDFLIAVAEKTAEGGEPFATVFRDMTIAFAMNDESWPHAAEARRPLEPHEETAVGIIYRSYEIAKQHGDRESVDEVVRFGCFLQARWHNYLAASLDDDGNRI